MTMMIWMMMMVLMLILVPLMGPLGLFCVGTGPRAMTKGTKPSPTSTFTTSVSTRGQGYWPVTWKFKLIATRPGSKKWCLKTNSFPTLNTMEVRKHSDPQLLFPHSYPSFAEAVFSEGSLGLP